MPGANTSPILIVISAPSGAGKTTLCSRILEKHQSKVVLSISSTTRKPRGQEKDGKEYFFVTPEQFEKGIREHRYVEWAKVHDHYYGTSKDVIEKALSDGKSVLLDIDVQGAASLRKLYKDRCFCVFIAPPSIDDLEKRLRKRATDPEHVIQSRMKTAHEEMLCSRDFDAIIVNDDLQAAQAELLSILEGRL